MMKAPQPCCHRRRTARVHYPKAPLASRTHDEYGNLYAFSGDQVDRLRFDETGIIQGKPIVLNQEPLPALKLVDPFVVLQQPHPDGASGC